MIHAVTHYLKLFDAGEGMTMVLGQASNAQLLEVGIVVWHGDLAIVHAMPARTQFLSFLR